MTSDKDDPRNVDPDIKRQDQEERSRLVAWQEEFETRLRRLEVQVDAIIFRRKLREQGH